MKIGVVGLGSMGYGIATHSFVPVTRYMGPT